MIIIRRVGSHFFEKILITLQTVQLVSESLLQLELMARLFKLMMLQLVLKLLRLVQSHAKPFQHLELGLSLLVLDI